MLLIECNKVKKYFSDRLIFDIENLKIYKDDRIGIVGVNGAGKSTLINILSRRLEPDEGFVKLNGGFGYISQLEDSEIEEIDGELAAKLGVNSGWRENLSGGEKTRYKIADALSRRELILFADEPTSNIDIEGITLIEERLAEYDGALVLISHDRQLLDRLCNKILELDNGKIKNYHGNYSDYVIQKSQERERAEFEYLQHTKEKRRLEEVIVATKDKLKSIRKTPKRMGNSEARLHKMGNQKAKANLDKAVKAVQSRIEQLEVKERPRELERIKLDVDVNDRLYSKIIIEGRGLNKRFDRKVIFDEAEFSIYNGSKVALIGPNGCGKSTLIKMIMNNEAGISTARGAKIGYFSQDLNILNGDLSIIDNVMASSIYNETFTRILLARLLFRGDAIYKKVKVLSGGERVKVSFAKILLQDINLLILDEPTNYMDISSLEIMEEALKEYNRSLLLVTHDRRLVEAIADNIMTIEGYKIKTFRGSYREFVASQEKSTELVIKDQDVEKQIFILENRLIEVLGKLSMPSKKEDIESLDKEYYRILGELKELKDRR